MTTVHLFFWMLKVKYYPPAATLFRSFPPHLTSPAVRRELYNGKYVQLPDLTGDTSQKNLNCTWMAQSRCRSLLEAQVKVEQWSCSLHPISVAISGDWHVCNTDNSQSENDKCICIRLHCAGKSKYFYTNWLIIVIFHEKHSFLADTL